MTRTPCIHTQTHAAPHTHLRALIHCHTRMHVLPPRRFLRPHDLQKVTCVKAPLSVWMKVTRVRLAWMIPTCVRMDPRDTDPQSKDPGRTCNLFCVLLVMLLRLKLMAEIVAVSCHGNCLCNFVILQHRALPALT